MRMFMLSFLLVFNLCAEPVGREAAAAAAAARLPQFYPGEWVPAGDYTLYDLAGGIAAYTFMFERSAKAAHAQGRRETPAEFVAARRAAIGESVIKARGNSPELYGAERFAAIVISADDTEPPVLRCGLGLPPQLVKERDAEALAKSAYAQGRWRVRRRLMLGMFDEAFECEDEEGREAPLVVEMRTGKTLPLAEAAERGRAKRKQAAAEPERERLCREAWAPFRGATRKGVRP